MRRLSILATITVGFFFLSAYESPALAQGTIYSNGCPIAKVGTLGCVMPDGSSITINAQGILSTTAGGGNVNGPGSTTNGFIATWANTGGTLLGTGLQAPSSGLVGISDTQTLTGKTLDGGSNSFTNIPLSAFANFSANSLIGNGRSASGAPQQLMLPGSACNGTNQAINWGGSGSTSFGCTTVSGTGSPGGSPNQIQWNNAGSFGGFTFSGDMTVVPSTGVASVTSIGGKAVSLAGGLTTTGTGSQTLAFPGTAFTYTFPANTGTIPELGLAQSWPALQTFPNGISGTLGTGTAASAVCQTSAGLLVASSAANCFGGGGSVSITSSAGGLTVSPSPLTGTGTVDLNLAHANTWSAAQSFSAGLNATLGTTGTIEGSVCVTSAGLVLQAASANCFGGGGGGTVTSLTAGNTGITLSPSTITSTGTISLGAPTATTLGGIESAAAVTHQWINSISTAGVPALSQPAAADISGLGTAATQAIGTSGATIPLLSTANTWTLAQTETVLPVWPSQTANRVYAAPNGSAGSPVFRALVAADIPAIPFTGLSGQATLTQLPSLSANTVLGALTATTPSGLALPSCSAGTSALTWTSGTGFGCNTISGTGVTSVAPGIGTNFTTITTTGSVALGTIQNYTTGTCTIVAANYQFNMGATLASPLSCALPAASTVTAGRMLKIVDSSGTVTGTNTLTIAANGSDTINGSASQLIAVAFGAMELASNGSNGWIIENDILAQTGTSGATIPLLNGNNTASGTWAFNGALTFGTGTTTGTASTAICLTSGNVVIKSSASANCFGTSGTTTVPNGGTGQTTFTAGALLAGNGTSALASVADVATGSVLLSQGTSTNPAYQAVGAGITTAGGTTLASTDAINAQSGTSYAVATTDAAKLVTVTNAASIAVSLSVATTSGFGAGFGFDLENLASAAGTATLTPTTSTIDGAASKAFPPGFSCHITSDGANYFSSLCGSKNTGGLAEKTIQFSPGLLTSVGTVFNHFVKHVKASTVDNMTASAMTLTCATNPTVLLAECGTSTTCASPTTIASVQITAAGTATVATVSSSAIAAGDYTAWEISGGVCTAVDLSGTAEIHAN